MRLRYVKRKKMNKALEKQDKKLTEKENQSLQLRKGPKNLQRTKGNLTEETVEVES